MVACYRNWFTYKKTLSKKLKTQVNTGWIFQRATSCQWYVGDTAIPMWVGRHGTQIHRIFSTRCYSWMRLQFICC